MVNKAILTGRVGRDADIRSMQNGKEVASFPFATSEKWKDKATGERKEKTEWHTIVIFSEGLVNLVRAYIRKGTQLYLEGQIQTRKWQDRDNNDRYKTEIVLQGYDCKLEMLSSGDKESRDSDYSKVEQAESINESPVFGDLDDEIPF